MKPSPGPRLHVSRWLTMLLALALVSSTFARQSVAAKSAPPLSKSEREASAQLKVETIREVTTALASKEFEGRGTAQPGADKAARYIADRFAKIGLKPAGDAGTYQQAIKFKSEQVRTETSFKAGDVTFKLKEDFVVATPFPTDEKDPAGGLVFVGYGVVSPDVKRDDLAGVDVKGKIVVLLGGDPKNVDQAAWDRASNQQLVFGRLIGSGAAGFVVTFVGRQTQPFPLVGTYLMRRRVSLADAPRLPIRVPPILLVSDNTAEKLFAGSGVTYAEAKAKAEAGEFVSRDLGKQASISVRIRREEGTSSNVAAVFEGADAKLKEEAVVYSAHYDAYGVEADGTIYPGAADNALGVAKLIAIAEAFARSKAKPRRSIIFLAFTGEEYGLLGAEHWVKHPTWPIEKVAANINYDGIGTEVWGPLKILVDYGFTHSDLGAAITGVASAMSLAIAPDPFPDEGVFYRSDHYAFFKKGVPSLYLIGGTSGDQAALAARAMKWLVTDYHMTTDTVRQDWHWAGARDLAVVGLVVGMRLADQDAMPAWLPSSPYNRPRGTNLPPPPRQ
ncbi:MAG TPA: M28 family peptidase [Blastocatellia bacterium]|nr:M28 family peptidase [Blastocatellia bacterium]